MGFKAENAPNLFGSASYSSRSSEFLRHLLTTDLLIFVVHAYVPPKIKNNKVLLKRNQIKIKKEATHFVAVNIHLPFTHFSYVNMTRQDAYDVNSRHQLSAWCQKKTCLLRFQPGPTQTGLRSHRRWLEALNYGFRKYRDCTVYAADLRLCFCIWKGKVSRDAAQLSGCRACDMTDYVRTL